MNKPTNSRDRLLADTFTTGWTDGPVAHFAQIAALHIRRRRARRQTLATIICTAPIIILFAFLARPPSTPKTSSTPNAPIAASHEFLSDSELLALIQDRPVMLVYHDKKSPELIFLSP